MNREETPWKLDYNWHANTIYFANEVDMHQYTYAIRDLWKHKEMMPPISLNEWHRFSIHIPIPIHMSGRIARITNQF